MLPLRSGHETPAPLPPFEGRPRYPLGSILLRDYIYVVRACLYAVQVSSSEVPRPRVSRTPATRIPTRFFSRVFATLSPLPLSDFFLFFFFFNTFITLLSFVGNFSSPDETNKIYIRKVELLFELARRSKPFRLTSVRVLRFGDKFPRKFSKFFVKVVGSVRFL